MALDFVWLSSSFLNQNIKILLYLFETNSIPRIRCFCTLKIIHLKLVPASFYFFHQTIPLQKTMKNVFLFHLRSSFCSWDIHISVFLPSPLFLSGSHCFRGWSKINLKVYGVINCLNKNSITHFVWYLEKEKRYDIETLSIDR